MTCKKQSRKRPNHIFKAIKSSINLEVFLGYIKTNRDKCAAIVNQQNYYGKTPLCIVAESPTNDGSSEACADLLLQAGARTSVGTVNPLLAAIKTKNYKVMRLLHKHGANPNEQGDFLSPIQFAIQNNDSRLLSEILDWNETRLDYKVVDDENKNIFHVIA
jgi:ankyrin repeat protein